MLIPPNPKDAPWARDLITVEAASSRAQETRLFEHHVKNNIHHIITPSATAWIQQPSCCLSQILTSTFFSLLSGVVFCCSNPSNSRFSHAEMPSAQSKLLQPFSVKSGDGWAWAPPNKEFLKYSYQPVRHNNHATFKVTYISFPALSDAHVKLKLNV